MRKVLIANRGEIAVRIARACDDAQLASVAVYADIDADALHVSAADEAFSLHGNSPADTYLNIPKLLAVGGRIRRRRRPPRLRVPVRERRLRPGRPGRRADLDRPRPDAIRLLGNKITARDAAVRAGAPLVAGSDGPVATAAEARAFAEQHGLPIAIKAAFGGGGRGLKVVRDLDEVEEPSTPPSGKPSLPSAAANASWNATWTGPGTWRRRSWRTARQRGGGRNPGLLPAAPAPETRRGGARAVPEREQTRQIYDAAKAVCREASSSGAGTVEFLRRRRRHRRLPRGEHPPAGGAPHHRGNHRHRPGPGAVPDRRRRAAAPHGDPEPRGHSFEFRLNAEDRDAGFLPSPGTIASSADPPGRASGWDTGVRSGSFVAPQFDSLLAKLIVTGADRQQALRRARRALAEMRSPGWPPCCRSTGPCWNPRTSPPRTGLGIHTRWIETDFADSIPADPGLQHHRARRRTPHHHRRRGRPAPRRRPSGRPAGRLGPLGRGPCPPGCP